MVLIFSGGGLAGCATHYESDNPRGWDRYEWCERVKGPRVPEECPKAGKGYIEEDEGHLAQGGFQVGGFSDEAE